MSDDDYYRSSFYRESEEIERCACGELPENCSCDLTDAKLQEMEAEAYERYLVKHEASIKQLEEMDWVRKQQCR